MRKYIIGWLLFGFMFFINTGIFGIKTKNIQNIISQQVDTNVVLPPAWAFGIIYGGYTNQQQTISRLTDIIKHDYPIDAYWIDSWFWSFTDHGKGPAKYIDFVGDTIDFPDRKTMWDFMQNHNIKGGFWIWDCIFQTGNEAAFNEFDSKGFFKNKYVEHNPWHNYSTTTAMHQTGDAKGGTLCGNIDFKNPEAIEYFKLRMKPFFDEGADFLKLDRTADISVCKTMFEITQESGMETKGRGFILSHSNGLETSEYKKYPAKWTDDTRSDWTTGKPTKNFNSWVPAIALKENIAMFTDTSLKSSKIPFLTNDLGGFDRGITDNLDEELYIRWMEFSFFTPIVEVFSQPENKTSNLAYLYSEKADSLFKNYSHLRMELFPYIYSYAHLVRLQSKQMINSLPSDKYNYMFGNELMVAPVYKQHATNRQITLPDGNWVNFWTEKILEGKKSYTIDAPIEQIPLFVRQGSIIPQRIYKSSIARGTNDTLNIHIYPGADSEFTLVEDDGTSNGYLNNEIAITKMQLKSGKSGFTFFVLPVSGFYTDMQQKRNIKLIIHSPNEIKKAKMNGKNMKLKKQNSIYESNYSTVLKENKSEFRVIFSK